MDFTKEALLFREQKSPGKGGFPKTSVFGKATLDLYEKMGF
jgi:hypothetical protein